MAPCSLNDTESSAEFINTTEIIRNSFSLLTAVCHMAGLVFLVRLRSHLNQTLIIVNLAVVEMVTCLNIPLISKLRGMLVPFMALKVSSNLAVRLFMLVLLADRYLAIHLNIKYPVIVTRGRIFKMSSLIWIVSCFYGLIQAMFAVIGDSNAGLNKRVYRAWFIHNYTVLVFDAIFTFSSILMFSYFYLKIKWNQLKDNARKPSEFKRPKSGRSFNYRIPFVIIGTCLVFNVASDILYQVRTYKVRNASKGCCIDCELIVNIASFLQISGYFSNAIVYIAMQKNNRISFLRKVLIQINTAKSFKHTANQLQN